MAGNRMTVGDIAMLLALTGDVQQLNSLALVNLRTQIIFLCCSRIGMAS
ncbi:hypothetical protein [Nostoc sp.]